MDEDKIGEVGNIFYFSQSVDKRVESALDAYKKGEGTAAILELESLIDQGHKEAFTFIGALYECGGCGIDRDLKTAIFYYQKSIEEVGAVEGYLGLARIYYYGQEPIQDYCKAFGYYEKVAEELNDGFSLFMVGLMYYRGECVSRDLEKAPEYFKRSWESGYILGLTYLGILESRAGHFLKGWWMRFKAGFLTFKVAGRNINDLRIRER